MLLFVLLLATSRIEKGGITMEFSKIIRRGIILAAVITLISLVGMGVIDIVAFGIIGLLVLIAAGIATLVHNQKVD